MTETEDRLNKKVEDLIVLSEHPLQHQPLIRQKIASLKKEAYALILLRAHEMFPDLPGNYGYWDY